MTTLNTLAVFGGTWHQVSDDCHQRSMFLKMSTLSCIVFCDALISQSLLFVCFQISNHLVIQSLWRHLVSHNRFSLLNISQNLPIYYYYRLISLNCLIHYQSVICFFFLCFNFSFLFSSICLCPMVYTWGQWLKGFQFIATISTSMILIPIYSCRLEPRGV